VRVRTEETPNGELHGWYINVAALRLGCRTLGERCLGRPEILGSRWAISSHTPCGILSWGAGFQVASGSEGLMLQGKGGATGQLSPRHYRPS
jgi:hypothetical protein